jgi:hypothetical protein
LVLTPERRVAHPLLETSVRGSPQHPAKQHRIHATAKANPPIDFDHWNARIEPFSQLRISVDVDTGGHNAMLLEYVLCHVTKVAAAAGV